MKNYIFLCQVLLDFKKFCHNFSQFPKSYYSIMVETHAIEHRPHQPDFEKITR